MKLKVNYNELRTGIRTYLPTCALKTPVLYSGYTNDPWSDDLYTRFKESQFGTFQAHFERVLDMMGNLGDYHAGGYFGQFTYQYRCAFDELQFFIKYYEELAKEAEKYDGKKIHVSLEKDLKKNLSLGALGAASKNYRGLMKLYGKKKANSILKKAKKETGAKVVVKKEKIFEGTRIRTYNKYSIVAKKEKGSSKGSGASTGAKKTKKSKTKTVKKKKK